MEGNGSATAKGGWSLYDDITSFYDFTASYLDGGNGAQYRVAPAIEKRDLFAPIKVSPIPMGNPWDDA